MSIAVVPRPASVVAGVGEFELRADATVSATGEGATTVAEYLAALLGLRLAARDGDIALRVAPTTPPGGYGLEVTEGGIRLEAADAAGLFAGAQSLRQLVSPARTNATEPGGAIEPGDAPAPAPAPAPEGTVRVPCVRIDDHPRFAYRGAMLDVARHFFPVDAVLRYIDDIAMLKFNHLHLHLTDDQGWRIPIESWPELTGVGASTQVGGSGGGGALHYTRDEYRRIVEYAASRFITIVPEIDVPGHTNAALASYPGLNPDGVARAPYEGIEVGFSSLDIGSETTYRFLRDVLREVAELTPGPYLHLGGDESLSTPDEDYLAFIARATREAAALGKTLIGWHEMGRSRDLPPGTIGQYWSFTTPQEGAAEHTHSFVEQGGQVIMSPADVAYLDIAYETESPLGLVWANGPTSLREAYEWDPADIVPGVGESELLGVEAPLWSETITTIAEAETMAFPRIAAIAEIAWSPRAGHDFEHFARRLAAFGGVMDAAGIRFTRVAGVDWPAV